MRLTLAQALSPLSNVFEPASYNRLVKRWASKKDLTLEDIQTISHVLHEHRYLFNRESLNQALNRTKYAYSIFIQSQNNGLVQVQDPELSKMIKDGVGANLWLAAITYAFHKGAPLVSLGSESGRITFKLFMASLSIIKREQKPNPAQKSSKKSSKLRSPIGYAAEQDETAPVLDASTMTLEEQIQKFNLHRDTYW